MTTHDLRRLYDLGHRPLTAPRSASPLGRHMPPIGLPHLLAALRAARAERIIRTP